jgi:hypothetical protein
MAEKPPLGAVLSVVGAVAVAIGTWIFLRRATDVGLDRLARIERMQKVCVERYTYARNRLDTMRVDRSALPDTIDARSKDRIDRCGAFRVEGLKAELPNAREMSGDPMPRGLR